MRQVFQIAGVTALLAVAAGVSVAPVTAEPAAQERSARTFTRDALCGLVDAAAARHGLPTEFFTRLIWKESSFRISVVSPKGAQGIAQFMPSTARERGLDDPFDPEAAIPASAHLLSDLDAEFGNLGLAAAAYNAGRRRVSEWIADAGGLPWETRDYVVWITGHSAEDWRAADAPVRARQQPSSDCMSVVATLGRPPVQTLAGVAPRAPWGVQLAGHFSQSRALAGYAAVQRRHADLIGHLDAMLIPTRNRGRGRAAVYGARVPAQTREEAEALCRRLRSAGADCVVLRS